MKTNGNDSAFNTRTFTPNGSNRFEGTQSLTKREYFAGLVMQGFAVDPQIIGDKTDLATSAVEWADALIDALNEEAQ